jgi:chemotaxis protein CheX
MLSATEAKVHREELAQITESVFATMVGIEIQRINEPVPPSPNLLTATVQLAGAWKGAVLIQCFSAQACLFAGLFLSVRTPTSVSDDVLDVLGELANMVAGNLKCVLSKGVKVSMPRVIEGADWVSHFSGKGFAERLAFYGAGGPFWVTLIYDCSREDAQFRN